MPGQARILNVKILWWIQLIPMEMLQLVDLLVGHFGGQSRIEEAIVTCMLCCIMLFYFSLLEYKLLCKGIGFQFLDRS